MPAKTRTRRTGRDDVQLYIRNFPAELKAALAALADAEGTNFNDLAVARLAELHRVAYERRPHRSTGIGSSPSVVLVMPRALRAKIKAQAGGRDVPADRYVIGLLTDPAEPAAA